MMVRLPRDVCRILRSGVPALITRLSDKGSRKSRNVAEPSGEVAFGSAIGQPATGAGMQYPVLSRDWRATSET